VDEFGDLMLNKKGRGESIKRSITTIAQKARAAGIHLILATQRPSVNIVDGTIKANFPTRIALKTASPKDSEVILGAGGAEKLCGKGDMLLMRSDSGELVRLQGFSFVNCMICPNCAVQMHGSMW
jgi:DNA segregation ATPase FtsK/SpoIIIE, S-DNA-T family